MIAKRQSVCAAVLVTLALSAALIDVGPSPASGAARVGRGRGRIDVLAPNPERCDPIAPRGCLYPFPNDHFTVADKTSDTGRRIALVRASMPTNVKGVAVDPTEWNRNDGFSPGQPITVFVPGLDLQATGAAPVTDIGESLERDAPIVVLDTTTGKRHPYWAELDVSATRDGETDPALYVRPAVNYREGHHYVVALRHLKGHDGRTMPPTAAFRAYRDHLDTGNPALEQRRPAMEKVLKRLARAGVHRRDLYLAWDFTVASERNLSERVLRMRDDAMHGLGRTRSPHFTVTPADQVTDQSGNGGRVVEGTFEVPLYLTKGGASGSRLVYGPDGLPQRTGTYTANFDCVLPTVAAPGGKPTRALVYGHGLLGSRDEVLGFGRYADNYNSVLCATDWIGLAEDDVANAAAILQDLSNMPTLPDRVQQSFVNFQYLARLLKSPDGFASDPAFQTADGRPVFATGDVAYWGRSQGGIFGGGATAMSTEWTRAVLGEAAANYSTLLTRSVDFDDYSPVAKSSYPNFDDRPMLQNLIQMLWDRGESNGYAAHVAHDPLPGTPKHKVLIFEAFGDHQVANVATEVMARTIGVKLRTPALAPGRSPDRKPFWRLPRIHEYPYRGSALLMWDFGTPRPPTDNVPPRGPAFGDDPHDMDHGTPEALDAITRYLAPDGSLGIICGGDPCNAKPIFDD